MSGALRKKPNCFNLLRQLNVLHKMRRTDVGGLEVSGLTLLAHEVLSTAGFYESVVLNLMVMCEAWSKASDLAAAYDIGRAEAQAAMHLMQEVEPSIVEKLSDLVRPVQHRCSSCCCHFHALSGFRMF